jgi:hypothetical protein
LIRALFLLKKPVSLEYEAVMESLAVKTARAIHSEWLSWAALDCPDTGLPGELLKNAIYEQLIETRLQCLVETAAILDRSGRIRKVAGRLNHENSHVRARALEVLDNVGNMKVNRLITGLMDVSSADGHIHVARLELKSDPPQAGDVVGVCTRSEDLWVKKCAEYAAGFHNAACR